MKTKTQRHLEDRELNRATSKPETVNQCLRTARTFVHHYNSTQCCNTETVFLILPFLQTNITSQMWPTGGKGVESMKAVMQYFSKKAFTLDSTVSDLTRSKLRYTYTQIILFSYNHKPLCHGMIILYGGKSRGNA